MYLKIVERFGIFRFSFWGQRNALASGYVRFYVFMVCLRVKVLYFLFHVQRFFIFSLSHTKEIFWVLFGVSIDVLLSGL